MEPKAGRRKVDPYHIWYAAGALYLIGYCHKRQDVRMFAIDRISTLAVTHLPCQMPLGFNAAEYVKEALNVMRDGPHIEVELRFDRGTSAWAKNRIWHSSQKASADQDGCLTLSLEVADSPEVVGWILSFGAGVRMAKREALRRRVLTAAAKIVNQSDVSRHRPERPWQPMDINS